MKTLDAGQAETNKLIDKVEKRVNKEYSQATKDMQKKLNNYLKSFEKKDKEQQKALADGLITNQQYKDWRYGQIMVGQRWQEQLDVLSKDLENSRQIAMNIVSGELPSAYAIGHNYGTYLVENGSKLNTSYTLYDRDTVSKLIKDRPKLLPDPTKGSKTQMALKEKQIQKWSKAKMTSAIAQGVLQGEAIPKIAERLRTVTDMSYRASIRNARTMLTSSENLGRQASFERAQDMGIEMQKQWMATLDDRTRDSHALMDGERVDIDESFSNGLDYPADPSGDPEEVYNCRCTMVTAIKGFEKAITDFDLSENEKLHGMTYEEWKDSHLHNETEEVVEGVSEKFEVANGENIIETWERREDEFDFEIEDAINAQGFDGLPRVVSAEEFDKAVQESNFIAQRTYSAPSQKILDEYREQLYNGKWYVDCSKGGAQYGQGMYCAADYTGSLSKGIKEEMQHYKDINLLSNKDGSSVTFFQMEQDAFKSQYKRLTGKAYDPANFDGSAWNMAQSEVRKYMRAEETTFTSFAEKYDLPYNFNKSYTETLTLDRTAKILQIHEPEDAINYLADEYAMAKLEKQSQKDLLSRYSKLQKQIDAEKNVEKLDALYEKRNAIAEKSEWVEINRLRSQFFGKYGGKDAGVTASLMGYDAINAVGHGQSGSYTVILNRTKVIFKQP